MWIFLSSAFLSIVAAKSADDSYLVVRARQRGDIERVFPGAKVVRTPPPADYQYRALVLRNVVARTLADQATAISYVNFKDSVKDKLRKAVFTRVWFHVADGYAPPHTRARRGSSPRASVSRGSQPSLSLLSPNERVQS